VAEIERAVSQQDLSGERVLISAGPNREGIDPVRFISNRSTGRMGYALAAAAWRRGASVCLVTGPTALPVPHGVRVTAAVTAEDMLRAIDAELDAATIVIMAAAVADYRPKHRAAQKLKKGDGPMTLELERTTDILAQLASRKGDRFVVGFAAETENVIANAERKLRSKQLDMIVANDVGRADTGFEVDTNAVVILDAHGRVDLPLASKDEIAHQILDHVQARRRGAGGEAIRAARPGALRAAGKRRAPAGRRRA
jgi:phosphopantothenoylcysteine decarboxylase/phosphopantothenate--cysteine ligase